MSATEFATFCPLAKACDIIEPRWSLMVLGELWGGATRFNEIRRGLPAMSPTLLSRRLKELEQHGLIERIENPASGEISYLTTAMGNELFPIAKALGDWAHRFVDCDVSLEKLDARMLMWNVRRKMNTASFSRTRRTVIQFIFPDAPEADRNFWLVAKPGAPVDLCSIDAGHNVDLFVTAELKAMTAAWIGDTTFAREISAERIQLIGDPVLIRTIDRWLVRSIYAQAA